MTRAQASARRLWRPLLAAVTAAVLVVAGFALFSGSHSNGHRLVILSPSATFMSPGLQVRIAGQVVGSVVSAQPTRRGTARVVVQIDKAGSWPLPAGTTVQYRSGGTIAFSNQYVELTPRGHGHPLADGAVLQGRDVTQAVGFDQLFDIFNTPTRGKLKSLINEGGPALTAAEPGIRASLGSAPSALTEARDVLTALGSDPAQLSQLLSSTNHVVDAIQTADPGLSTLLSGAATTLNATTAQSRNLGRTLVELPGTLTQLDGTLARADVTLGDARTVLTRLGPGVDGVKALAPRLTSLLHRVMTVSPNGTAALVDLKAAVPDLNGLLNRADQLMPNLHAIGQLGAKELNCVRPYAPEAAGLASNWTGFIQRGDNADKYARINAGVYPYPATGVPLSPAAIIKVDPALHYVFPAPPGEVAGQPQFNSACGVGPDSLVAADDPENK